MDIHQAQKNTPGLVECLTGFAALAVVWDIPATGVRLLAAAAAIAGEDIASAWAATRMEYEHYLARVHLALTEREFQMEKAIGRGFSIEQASEYARNLPLNPAAKTRSDPAVDSLTLREREVAAMIAQGKSNGEIAGELVISKRTVEKHIANILSKLGFTTRAQIMRWTIETGLENSSE
jgi:non-specific serine/threonine protein kinase